MKRFRRLSGWVAVTVLLLGAGPFWNLASGAAVLQGDWSRAHRGSAGTAPDPAKVEEALVHVYAARAFEWRGAFAVHSWIAVKPAAARTWTTYQVIGWSVRRGGKAVVIRNEPPDRYWFGDAPVLLAELRGDGVGDIIARIDEAARAYPWNDVYAAWPGPNSNTFTAWIARQIPELGLDLPPTAIGKDWLGATTLAADAPSGTGYQFSVYGVFGVLAAWEEGVEVNIAGLTLGLDPGDMAVKLPGFGRIGPAQSGESGNTVLGSGSTKR